MAPGAPSGTASRTAQGVRARACSGSSRGLPPDVVGELGRRLEQRPPSPCVVQRQPVRRLRPPARHRREVAGGRERAGPGRRRSTSSSGTSARTAAARAATTGCRAASRRPRPGAARPAAGPRPGRGPAPPTRPSVSGSRSTGSNLCTLRNGASGPSSRLVDQRGERAPGRAGEADAHQQRSGQDPQAEEAPLRAFGRCATPTSPDARPPGQWPRPGAGSSRG